MEKDAYVLSMISLSIAYYAKQGKLIDPINLQTLIRQWEFDFEANKLNEKVN